MTVGSGMFSGFEAAEAGRQHIIMWQMLQIQILCKVHMKAADE